MRCVVKVDLAAKGIVGKDNPREKDCMLTEINGSVADTYEYYKVGKVFNMGLWYDSSLKEHEDSLMVVTDVFALEDCEDTQNFIVYLAAKYGWDWKEHFDEKEYAEFMS